MPVVFRHKGFRFVFYSNEGDPREPAHIHAIKDGFDARTLRELMEVIAQRREFILRTWDEFFGEG